MQVRKIQNNNINFNGILKIQNFRKGGKLIEREISGSVENSLSDTAHKNFFKGDWENRGFKYLHNDELTEYAEKVRNGLGINLPATHNEFERAEIVSNRQGYSIKVNNLYRITHIF